MSTAFIAVFGPLTRELGQVWNSRQTNDSDSVSDVYIWERSIQSLFNDISLFPSRSQVFEMVRCARESTPLENEPPGGDVLTFGEFCVFATELRRQYSTLSDSMSLSEKVSVADRCRAKKLDMLRAAKSSVYDVFLGGSCNPTTWRQDMAIPYFKSHGITYYNPQQSNWVPEMIELEHQAKQTSKILFYVLNELTRNVVSMIEVSYLAAQRRKLIVLLKPYPMSGHHINGELLLEAELNELQNALSTVHDLVERQGMPVFSNINDAMSCVHKIIKDNVAVEDLTLKDNAQPVKHAHIQIGDILVRLREAFDTLDTARVGRINMSDMRMAFRIHTHKELSQREMRHIVYTLTSTQNEPGSKASSIGLDRSKHEDVLVDFETFCKIVSEFQDHNLDRAKLWDVLTMRASRFLRCLLVHPVTLRHRRRSAASSGAGAPATYANHHSRSTRENSLTRTLRDRRGSSVRDVYLGGSMDMSNKWRETVAIPILKKNGLTYFNPQPSHEAMVLNSHRLLPIEAGAMDNSRVLLFVVLGAMPSVKAMCEAAYHIGLERNVVLCIEPVLTDDIRIDGHQLSSKCAIKDYKRGRAYLSDMANREGVPVFDSLHEAIGCVVNKCKAPST